MQKRYKKAPMVVWFHPVILFKAAIKALVSMVFGNYADRREMQAALDLEIGPGNQLSYRDLYYDHSLTPDKMPAQELWFDFVSDVGDGFNSTYSVATIIAKEKLLVKTKKGDVDLPRGVLLLMGGDQIYPTPSDDAYDNKFKIPYEAAFPQKQNIHERAQLFAIPGNHDWYDGLGSFLKVFCQKRSIGNWCTQQRRSYFAIKLFADVWVWGIDIQLNEDIDQPQQQYFINVGTCMHQDDKIILITAKPAWVYKELYLLDKTYKILDYFINHYITEDRSEAMKKTFKLLAVLTGDLHHYSHYCAVDEKGTCKDGAVHFIGAGGGGAFLHITHNLPERLTRIEEENVKPAKSNSGQAYTRQLTDTNIRLLKCFPSKSTSKSLAKGTLLFGVMNPMFLWIFGLFYCWIYWLVISLSIVKNTRYMDELKKADFNRFYWATKSVIAYNPSVLFLCVLMISGFSAFGDNKRTGKCWLKVYSGLHGVVFCLGIFISLWLIARLNYKLNFSFGNWLPLVLYIEVFIAGSVFGALVMGIYLYFANLFFHNHLDDVSNALVNQDYKNFLRMHITKNKLTIYPIGIEKVTRKWTTIQNDEDIRFKGDDPVYTLIEEPIEINIR